MGTMEIITHWLEATEQKRVRTTGTLGVQFSTLDHKIRILDMPNFNNSQLKSLRSLSYTNLTYKP